MTTAEVHLWGTRVGTVQWDDDAALGAFEYERDFLASGVEVAPLTMPLSRALFRFPALPRDTFHGLPGLLADALPDRFGNALINAWLARQGRGPGSMNPVERLCYTGTRGMGALEFFPKTGPELGESSPLQLDALVRLASQVLRERDGLTQQLDPGAETDALLEILRVGTSAGGARAKAVIAYNPNTGEVRSGQVDAGAGFEHWLLKFDGVDANRDRELADPQGYGAIEYAYYLMACDAGLDMSPCRLLHEGGRSHFMTRRFDRPGGDKLHMQTLGAIAHLDFNAPGAASYEQLFSVMRQLELTSASVEQAFRRMVFNVVFRNQDDHVKNTAFLMDKRGRWSLSPAYDVTYAYNPGGAWTARHQMSVNGKRGGEGDDAITRDDLRAAEKVARLPRGRAGRIADQLCAIAAQWPRYAAEAGVSDAHTAQVQAALRVDL